MSAWNIRVIFEPDVSLHFFYQANIDKDDDDDYDDDEENENKDGRQAVEAHGVAFCSEHMNSSL